MPEFTKKEPKKEPRKELKKVKKKDKSDVALPRPLLLAWRSALLRLAYQNPNRDTSDHSKSMIDIKLAAEEYQTELVELWESYNTDRSLLKKHTLTRRRTAVAYLLGMQLPNIARALGSIQRAKKIQDTLLGHIKSGQAVHLIDLGCGGAAMSLAWGQYLASLKLEPAKLHIHLYDHSRVLLQFAESQLGVFSTNIHTHSVSMEDFEVDRIANHFDPEAVYIVQLGYLLNELDQNTKALNAIAKLFSTLSEQRSILHIIEPAHQTPSRALMKMRAQLLQDEYFPIYPCGHQAPCPLLDKARDWCFSEFSFKRPPELVPVDRGMSRDSSLLSASSHIYVSSQMGKQIQTGNTPAVIVGRPTDVKPQPGKGPHRHEAFSYLLCSSAGIEKIPAASHRRPLRRGQRYRKLLGEDSLENKSKG